MNKDATLRGLLYIVPTPEPQPLIGTFEKPPYTAEEALYRLLRPFVDSYGEARYQADRAQHRLELGDRFFDDEQLAQARDELEKAKAQMNDALFWRRACLWGMPRGAWVCHEHQLQLLLEKAQHYEAPFRGLTMPDLINALWIAE